MSTSRHQFTDPTKPYRTIHALSGGNTMVDVLSGNTLSPDKPRLNVHFPSRSSFVSITGIPVPRNLNRLPPLAWPPMDIMPPRRVCADHRQLTLFPDLSVETSD